MLGGPLCIIEVVRPLTEGFVLRFDGHQEINQRTGRQGKDLCAISVSNYRSRDRIIDFLSFSQFPDYREAIKFVWRKRVPA